MPWHWSVVRDARLALPPFTDYKSGIFLEWLVAELTMERTYDEKSMVNNNENIDLACMHGPSSSLRNAS